MDLPFLLGTAFSPADRHAAPKALGYGPSLRCRPVLRVSSTTAIFVAIGHSGLGARRTVRSPSTALFVSSALVSVLLPIAHPRMGTSLSAPLPIARCSKPPGFMMLNYGRRHTARDKSWLTSPTGAIVGGLHRFLPS